MMSYKETAELMRETEQKIIKDILDDLIFDGECYKMSIKTYRKWRKNNG